MTQGSGDTRAGKQVKDIRQSQRWESQKTGIKTRQDKTENQTTKIKQETETYTTMTVLAR